MRAYIRHAVVPAVALLAVLVAGCSDEGGSDDAAPKQDPASEVPIDPADLPSQAPSSSAPSAPVLKIGESGEFETGEVDDNGTYKATSKMSVTAVSAKYADQTPIYGEPDNGQYVELTLTLKNIGDAPGRFASYGMMRWEDDQTATQDASSLAGVGEGPDLDTTYKPGQSVTGTLVLDIVRKGGTVSYVGSDDPWADKPAFSVELPQS
ncbi:DUF4352 domain-containing protein [Streptomyces sp. MH60]|uniref:DUF4352 domain-containing protein n=1 Tax=Streptomyces sp. MH60 TaxID=1940758 RepID=UPI0013008363|nr:DUF4352 domain-containing protein [Streptomyces sp. MH60]